MKNSNFFYKTENGTWRPVCTYSFWSLKVLFLRPFWSHQWLSFGWGEEGKLAFWFIWQLISFFSLLESAPRFGTKKKENILRERLLLFFCYPTLHTCALQKKQEIVPTFGRRLNSIHPTTTVVSPGKLWSLCQRERPRARWKKEKKRKYEVEPLADLKYFKAGEAKGNFVTGGGWARP